MYLLYLFVTLLCVYESQPKQDFYANKFMTENNPYFNNIEGSVKRLLELMRSYYEEANSRIYQLNRIRFLYEESPYYEMGFIIGEIIERYRKVLEMVQRPHTFMWYSVPDTLKLVEYTQKLYFELYHLVRMIHETPRKWVDTVEYTNIEKLAGPEAIVKKQNIDQGTGVKKSEWEDLFLEMSLKDLINQKKIMAEQQKYQQKIKKKQRKLEAKLRQAYLEGMLKQKYVKQKAYNSFWPLDYGWEVEFQW